MISENKNPWKILSKEKVYDNPWIALYHHKVLHPDNSDGIYGVVHFKDRAIGIIPLSEDGYTWLVGQYRFPLNKYSWEIPAGGSPANETSESSARRELQEETGIIAASYECILSDITLSNSVTDETADIFLATGLSFTETAPEPSEELHIKKVKIEEAIRMCLDGEIHDSISIFSLLFLKNKLGL